ncbi:hypothetical protein [Falsiroseomonas selenitidurans]|uniref:Uncharacterized protein n=1 Tax=Falsiroseomonas selenitidurans TaxID=2716335 RepID=A0ABX1ECJ6_9PROT|nr:hypothetical protein [Falsiroseomonas selenitidurans]NKC34603.1 hypothetical protein [Falsiroseomonas selenitidurans]
MILNLTMPPLADVEAGMTVHALHAAPGAPLAPGGRLLDIRLDLAASVQHDCPPVSFHRIVVRQRVWLRRLLVTVGQEVPLWAPIGLFSTEPDEPVDGPVAGSLRVSVANVLVEHDWA